MICPNCSFNQEDGLLECGRCGIIFAKFYARKKDNEQSQVKVLSDNGDQQNWASLSSWWRLLLYVKDDINMLFWLTRLALFAAMVWVSLTYISSPIQENTAGNSFLHLINLPFHEAGHVFLRPFGALITSLGGSLFQLLTPVVCGFVLLLQTRDTYGASVSLWWFGQNFFDLAPYINDARSLSLPLVGGNFGYSSPYGFHDWEFILTETGLLHYDHFLAKLSVFTGSLFIITALIWGAALLHKQYKHLE